mmetsp:Transcript_1683/g.3603  ORF Transcript_1683/g.3603 Transcript_1683/m.3603 type:complete len:283 (-) Transcript_1683:52-900(-)
MVVLHQILDEILVFLAFFIFIILVVLIHQGPRLELRVFRQLHACFQGPEEIPEKRRPRLLLLLLLLRLLCAAAFHLLRNPLHSHVLARMPMDLRDFDLFHIDLAGVRIAHLREILFLELGFREVRVRGKSKGECETLVAILRVNKTLLDVLQILQNGLIPLLHNVLRRGMILQGLQPEAGEARGADHRGILLRFSHEHLLPLFKQRLLLLVVLDREFVHLEIVLLFELEVFVVEFLQLLDDRWVLGRLLGVRLLLLAFVLLLLVLLLLVALLDQAHGNDGNG